jgi:uncharacterized LabA/DUF88 family protein
MPIRQDKRALVCIDYANLRYFLEERKINIDWSEFKSLMGDLYGSVELRIYLSRLTEGFYMHHHPNADKSSMFQAKQKDEEWRDSFKKMGYAVRQKPIARIMTEKGPIFKCNLDVEITIDVMDRLNSFDVLVLCSGDGDFIPLLKRVHGAKKETHVIGADGRINADLKQTANHYDEWSKMLFWVQRLSHTKKKP